MTLPDPGVTTPPTDEQWKVDVGRAMQVLRFGVAYRELDPDDQRDVLMVAEAIREAKIVVQAAYAAAREEIESAEADWAREIKTQSGHDQAYARGRRDQADADAAALDEASK